MLHLYDDHEVWEALGYEGESFSRGGYLHRGLRAPALHGRGLRMQRWG